jgi:hypothetical protein
MLNGDSDRVLVDNNKGGQKLDGYHHGMILDVLGTDKGCQFQVNTSREHLGHSGMKV